MFNLEYSSIKEMIESLESFFLEGQKVVDGWQEGDYFILVVANLVKADMGTRSHWNGSYYNTFRVKLQMPI